MKTTRNLVKSGSKNHLFGTDEVEIETEKDDLDVDIVKLYITDEKPTKSGQI